MTNLELEACKAPPIRDGQFVMQLQPEPASPSNHRELKHSVRAMKHTYLVLLGVALLLSSCLHISGPEVDENERFSRQVEKDLHARNVHKDSPFYVTGGWPTSYLRLSICDNRLVPAGRSRFGVDEVNVILRVMMNVSKEQAFPRNIVLLDSFSSRERFVILARGKGIKTIRPIQCTSNPPSYLPR